MSPISVGLPVRRLGHQAREGQGAGDGQNRERSPFLIEAETEFSDAKERGINKHAAKDPTEEVAPQVARDRNVAGELGYRLPASDLRTNLGIKLDERVLRYGRSEESNDDPNQCGD